MSGRDDEGRETDLRRLVFAEEDRRVFFPTVSYVGGFRWFRSPNVVDLVEVIQRNRSRSVSTAPSSPPRKSRK